MKRTTDVVVLGGGVIGCAVAYQLRKRHVEVVVVDQGEIGSGASRAATGLLAPVRPFLRPDEPYMALQLAALACLADTVSELEASSGLSIDFERTGTLRVVPLKQAPRLEQWIALWQQDGMAMELLAGDSLERVEPALSADIGAAIYNPGEPQLNAVQLMAAYAGAAESMGCSLLARHQVTGLLRCGQKVAGVSTVQGDILCNSLVMATGAWSAICGHWLGLTLPVRPLRGQSLSLLQPASPLRHIVFGEGVYLAPKPGGTLFVGATRDEAGFDASTTAEGLAWLRAAADRLVPVLEPQPVQRAWAGLRPQTPDSRPIVGRAPGWENVVLACGHGGFGMLLSTITGLAVADLLTTGQTHPLLQPFGFERFSSDRTSSDSLPEPALPVVAG